MVDEVTAEVVAIAEGEAIAEDALTEDTPTVDVPIEAVDRIIDLVPIEVDVITIAERTTAGQKPIAIEEIAMHVATADTAIEAIADMAIEVIVAIDEVTDTEVTIPEVAFI